MENSQYEFSVAEEIQDLLRFNVVKVDCLPWLICHSCLVRLSEFRDFRRRCVRSKLVFDSMFQLRADEVIHPSSKFKRKEELLLSREFRLNSKLDAEHLGLGMIQQTSDDNGGCTDAHSGRRLRDCGWDFGAEDTGGSGEYESAVEYCSCAVCKGEFMSFRELNAHMKLCRIEREWSSRSPDGQSKRDEEEDCEEFPIDACSFDPSLSCARCKRTFNSTERLVRHIEKYDFKCTEKRKGNKKNGQERMKDVCGNSEPLVCSTSFVSREQLHNGTFKKINQEGKPHLSCDRCGRIFKTAELFEQHLSINSFKCKGGSAQLSRTTMEIPESKIQIDPMSSKFCNNKSIELGRIGKRSMPSQKTTGTCDNFSFSRKCLPNSSEKRCHRRKIYDKSEKNTYENKVMSNKQSDYIQKGQGLSNVVSADGELVCGIQGTCGNEDTKYQDSMSERNSKTGDVRGVDILSGGEIYLNGGVNNDNQKFLNFQSTVTNELMEEEVNPRKGTGYYVCDYCNKSYTTKSDLRNHIVKCHLSLDPQKCPVCHRLFMNSEELEEHSCLHPRDKKFYCTVCEESFISKNVLRKHMIGKHNINTPCICSICFNGFTSRAGVGLHQSLVHKDSEKPFNCTACGRFYTEKGNYKLHVKFCQLKSKSFQCNVCGKKLCTKSQLDIHSLIHLRVKKFACSMCPTAFSQCGTRNRHIRIFHLKLRPHECGICNKRFPTKERLQKHYISHSDDRP